MISDVTMTESRYKKPPHKFEAGTGNIADAIALGCALDYITQLDLEMISRYEHHLLAYMTAALSQLPGLTMIGNTTDKSGIVSFHIDALDSDAAAALFDREGIALRAGHHCAQPALRRFGFEKIVRASLALYNTTDEIDTFISVLSRLTT